MPTLGIGREPLPGSRGGQSSPPLLSARPTGADRKRAPGRDLPDFRVSALPAASSSGHRQRVYCSPVLLGETAHARRLRCRNTVPPSLTSGPLYRAAQRSAEEKKGAPPLEPDRTRRDGADPVHPPSLCLYRIRHRLSSPDRPRHGGGIPCRRGARTHHSRGTDNAGCHRYAHSIADHGAPYSRVHTRCTGSRAGLADLYPRADASRSHSPHPPAIQFTSDPAIDPCNLTGHSCHPCGRQDDQRRGRFPDRLGRRAQCRCLSPDLCLSREPWQHGAQRPPGYLGFGLSSLEPGRGG